MAQHFLSIPGRARSYLIKSRIDYREEPHASDHYYNSSLAQGRRGDAGVPTVEFANGDVIRDGGSDHRSFRRFKRIPATRRSRQGSA